jgi:hypothetical protein
LGNFSFHPKFLFSLKKLGETLSKVFFKEKKNHTHKNKGKFGGKEKLHLKNFGRRFPKFFCVKREI